MKRGSISALGSVRNSQAQPWPCGHSQARRGIVAGLALLVTLSLPWQTADADPVSAGQAQAMVKGWLKLCPSPLGAKLGGQIKEVVTFPDGQGRAAYYVVYLDPSGFVIVPADDFVEPIVSFAAGGRYDPSPRTPFGALASQDLLSRVVAVRAGQAQGAGAALRKCIEDARRKWRWLTDPTSRLGGKGIGSVSDERVAPLVESRWGQTNVRGDACYNYYTPPNAAGSSSNYPCGCVATAMGQLMRFHEHPVAGVGTASFTIYVDGSPESRNLRGGDGAGGAYDWGSMTFVPDSGVTLAGRQAIGALCQDAGVSVNMSYTSSSSGTDTRLAANAFRNTFGYANAVRAWNGGGNFTQTNLHNMLNPNLDAALPTLLGITGSPGGHAIVCDGYGYSSSTLYHHLNMGWAGSYDAWYDLPYIDAGSYVFTTVYKAVYNVFETGSGEIISGRVVDEADQPISGAAITATRAGGETYTAATNAKGIYALTHVPSGSSCTVSATKAGYTFEDQNANTGTSTDDAASSGNAWGVDFAPGGGDPPPVPQDPDPADGATDVALDTDLSWSRGLLYAEDFNDGLAQDWEEVTDAQWSVQSGEYRAMAGTTYEHMQSTYSAQAWADCSAQVTVYRTGYTPSASVLVLRATPDLDWPSETGSAYLIGISGRGRYYVAKYVAGVLSMIQAWAESPYLNLAGSNVVRGVIEGSSISVHFNGDLAWSGSDTSISAAGRVGMMGYSGSASETVHYFDDVQVDTPSAASAGPLSALQAWYNAHPLSGGPEAAPSQDQTPRPPAELLTRAGGESKDDPVTYDVYLDTTNPPTALIHSGLTTSTCSPGTLAADTTYYWKVVAINGHGNTPGPVWSFTTGGPPPPAPCNPDPRDGATDVALDTDLSWNRGLLYAEDFNDGLAQDWDEVTDEQWSVQSGEYRAMAGTTGEFMQSTYSAQTWADCSAQVTVHRTGEIWSASVLVLRATPDFDCRSETGSAYLIGVSWDESYYVGKYVSGIYSMIQDWTDSPHLNTTGSNEVRGVIEGSSLAVYLNGQLAWSGSDTSITAAGRIGILAYSGGDSETVHYFDDVQVDPPSATSARTVSPLQAWYNAHPLSGGPEAAPSQERTPPPPELLTRAGGESKDDPVTYDVYLDTTNPPTALIHSGLTTITCSPGTLIAGTTYYWKVVATNANGSTPGPVWSFTTAGSLPCALTVTEAGAGDGGILVNGDAHSLPYSGSFPCGTALTLTAVPSGGSRFVSWSGDVLAGGWSRTMGGYEVRGHSAAVDGSGNVYVAGYFHTSAVDFDPTDGTDVHTPAGGSDVFVTKLLRDGSYGWTRTMGGEGWDYGNAAAVDASGNVFVAGRFSGEDVDFDPTEGVDLHSSVGSWDVFVTKLHSDGSYGWTRTLGGASNDTAHGASVDGTGNVYVAGEFYSSNADFDPTAGVDLHSPTGAADVFVTKLGSDGSYGWTRTMGGPSNDCANRVSVGGSASVYVVGYFADSDVDFDPTSGVDLHSSNGEEDVFVAKLGIDGSYQWTRTLGGTSHDFAEAVRVDGSGNAFVAGHFEGSDVDFDPTTGVDQHSSNGAEDLFVTKLHSDGSYGWTGVMGGDSSDKALGVSVDSAGNVLVTGSFESSSVDFDPTSGEDLHSRKGSLDVFVTKLMAGGAYGWTGTIGGSSGRGVFASDVALDASGHVLLTGYFWGSDVDFDPTGGEDLHSAIGATDVFVTRLRPDGTYSGPGDDPTRNPLLLVMDSDKTVTATFGLVEYALTTRVAPSGSGRVDPVSAIAPYGTVLAVTATANVGWRFDCWSGDVAHTTTAAATVTMDADKSVTAHFLSYTQTLTVTKSGAGKGGILINGAARGLPYSGSFAGSSVLTLTAVAGGGSAFMRWSGDATGTANPIVLSMAADRSLDACFDPLVKTRFSTSPKAVPVYIDATPYDTPCGPSYAAGTTHTVGVESPVTLTDYTRLTFSHWAPEADQWHVLTWPSVGMKYTAYYDAHLKVTAEVSPPGSGTTTVMPDALGGWYSPGSRIAFYATAAPGYEFWHWEFVKRGKTKDNPTVHDIGKSPVVAIAHMQAEESVVGRPELVAPIGEVRALTQVFRWSGVPRAKRYDLWVSRSRTMSDPVLVRPGLAAATAGPVPGLAEGDYVWWVRAWLDDGEPVWSLPVEFTKYLGQAEGLLAPVAVEPQGDVVAGQVTFRWTDVPGAAAYDLWVSRKGRALPACRNPRVPGTSCTIVVAAGHYLWAVRATSPQNSGPWSGLAEFAAGR